MEWFRQLGRAMYALTDVSEQAVDDVLDDFVDRARDLYPLVMRTVAGAERAPPLSVTVKRKLSGPW